MKNYGFVFSEVYFVGALLLFVNTRKIMSNIFSAGLANPCRAQCSSLIFSGLISRI